MYLTDIPFIVNLAYSSPWCYHMPLIHQRRVSSYILEPTVSCLTLPGWEPKQKWDMSSSETCFSQMMLHWWLIQWKTCMQQLIDRLSHAWKEFGLTISIKKTKVMGQGIVSPSSINIDNMTLEAVDSLTHLGSTIDSNLSLDAEINTRIAKAAAVMSKLNRRVWQNHNLTHMTKLCAYQACVLITLLYSSEAWTTYTTQEKKLNSFHLRDAKDAFLHLLAGQDYQHKDTGACFQPHNVHTAKPTALLGHVHIPRDMYGELVTGTRTVGRPYLRYRDTCTRDMKMAGIDTTACMRGSRRWSWALASSRKGRNEKRRIDMCMNLKRGRRGSKSLPTLHTLLNQISTSATNTAETDML